MKINSNGSVRCTSMRLGCRILAGLIVFALERWNWVCLKSLVIYFLASQVFPYRYPKVPFIAHSSFSTVI